MAAVKKKASAIHVGINYLDALSSKKELLNAEAHMLKIIKFMRSYSSLRKREFVLKNRARKSLTSIKTTIKKIEQDFPEVENTLLPKIMPKIQEIEIEVRKIEPTTEEKTEKKERKKAQQIRHSEIESELDEIQKKLNSLS